METIKKTPSIIPFIQTPGLSINQGYDANAARHLPKKIVFDSNEIFRSIWDHSSDGLCLTDSNGLIVLVNQAFCEMFGKNEDEMIGYLHTDLFSDNIEKETYASDYYEKFTSGKTTPRFFRNYFLWSGKKLEAEVLSSFVADEKGNRLMVTQFRDVTKEQEAYRSLKVSEEKYRNLFANSPMPIFQCSVEGRIINANSAFLRLLGYDSFYEFIDLDVSTMLFANDEERSDFLQTLDQRGYIVKTELQLKRKNGRMLTVLETTRAIKNADGRMTGFEGMLEDVTARKVIEKRLHEYVWALEKTKKDLSELNAQKDKLFSILSHDLRSPFSSILGFCDIIIHEHTQLKEDETLQFVKYIQEAAQDQLTLVNKLLDWSRLESGRIKIEYADVDVTDVVDKSVRALLGLAHTKNVSLISTLPLNVMINGDQSLITQVFNNLIGNALKFTPEHGSISLALREEKSDCWIVTVRDTGIGIPKEDIGKLFRIEEKYTRKGLSGEKGTGLGLPIVAEIIEKHHGSISVESKEGEGSTFTITLPKRKNEEGKVLIVDDEHGIRVLHARYIQRAFPNLKILHAADGKEAFEMACEHHPQLIISDSDMHGLDGDRLVYQLKSQAETKDIPIIIVTGHDSETNKENLIQHGVTEILAKPVEPENFIEIISTLLKEPTQVVTA